MRNAGHCVVSTIDARPQSILSYGPGLTGVCQFLTLAGFMFQLEQESPAVADKPARRL